MKLYDHFGVLLTKLHIALKFLFLFPLFMKLLSLIVLFYLILSCVMLS